MDFRGYSSDFLKYFGKYFSRIFIEEAVIQLVYYSRASLNNRRFLKLSLLHGIFISIFKNSFGYLKIVTLSINTLLHPLKPLVETLFELRLRNLMNRSKARANSVSFLYFFPSNSFLTNLNNQKSHGARSKDYGGCPISVQLDSR